MKCICNLSWACRTHLFLIHYLVYILYLSPVLVVMIIHSCHLISLCSSSSRSQDLSLFWIWRNGGTEGATEIKNLYSMLLLSFWMLDFYWKFPKLLEIWNEYFKNYPFIFHGWCLPWVSLDRFCPSCISSPKGNWVPLGHRQAVDPCFLLKRAVMWHLLFCPGAGILALCSCMPFPFNSLEL